MIFVLIYHPNRLINKEVYQEHIVEETNTENDNWVMTDHFNINLKLKTHQKNDLDDDKILN